MNGIDPRSPMGTDAATQHIAWKRSGWGGDPRVEEADMREAQGQGLAPIRVEARGYRSLHQTAESGISTGEHRIPLC